MKELKKHLVLWGILIKNSLMSQLEYRANFFSGIAMELGYFLAKIVYMIVIYKTNVPINGLTPDEVLVFFGTYMVATGPYAGLYLMNLFDIGRQVQTGELDLLLVKPVSLQFMLTLKRSDMSLFTTDVLLGIAAITVGLSRMAVSVSLLDILGFLGYLASGSLIAYSMDKTHRLTPLPRRRQCLPESGAEKMRKRSLPGLPPESTRSGWRSSRCCTARKACWWIATACIFRSC